MSQWSDPWLTFTSLSNPSPYCQCAPVSSAVSCPHVMALPVRWGPRRTWQLCRLAGSLPPRLGERSLRWGPPRLWPFAADPLWVRRRGWQGLGHRASPVPVLSRGLWGPLRTEVVLLPNAHEGPWRCGWAQIPDCSVSLRSEHRSLWWDQWGRFRFTSCIIRDGHEYSEVTAIIEYESTLSVHHRFWHIIIIIF